MPGIRPNNPSIGVVTRCVYSLAASVMAACWPMAVVAQTAATDVASPDNPNPEVAAALKQLTTTTDEPERQLALDRLRQMDAADRTAFIRELVYFARDARSTKEGMIGGAVLEELNVSDESVIEAVVPLLDSEDDRLRAQVRNILGGYEGQSADRPPDFSVYRAMIADTVREGEQLPLGLIEYMYDKSPGAALLSIMRAVVVREPERLKRIRWAEHVVADVIWKQQYGFLKPTDAEPAALEQLATLAQDDGWWVRLYAAEIMRKCPAFRQDSLIEQLTDDENGLVRQSATRAAEAGAQSN